MKTSQKITYTLTLFLVCLFLSTTTKAQTITVKGVVKGETAFETEALNGVNIYLKDKSVITTSNKKGEFTFPKALKIGDVLVFSYLGYLKKSVTISEKSTNLNIILKEDDNEMLGALSSGKRYTSKRKAN